MYKPVCPPGQSMARSVARSMARSIIWAMTLSMIWSIAVCAGPAVSDTTLTREHAVRLALEHNPEVLAARARWQQLETLAQSLWVPADPELSAEFEGLSAVTHPEDFDERNIGVTQSLGTPWKWHHRRRAARAEADAARYAQYEQTRVDLTSRVRLAFDRLLSRAQVLEYEQQQHGLTREFADREGLRTQAGDVSELPALRAEMEAGRAASRVAAARRDVHVARAELNALLGRATDEPVVAAGQLEVIPMTWTPAQLRRLALSGRADLRGQQHAATASRARHGAEVAAIWPDMRLGVFRQTFRTPGSRESRWRVGLGLDIPLWAGWRQRSEIAARRARVTQMTAEQEGLRRQVELEVDVAYQNLLAADQQVTMFQGSVLDLALRAQEAVARSHAAGKVGYLEVIDVQQNVLATRVEYAHALLAYRAALIALDRATGGQLINGGSAL